MSDTKTRLAKLEKAARIATSGEILARELAVVEFLGWAESVKVGRGSIVIPQERRDALAEIKRIKEAA